MNIAEYIDHALLKPDATDEQIAQLCEEANSYEFKAVCVNPCKVVLCSDILSGSDVLICTVIGFPLGANETEVKMYEAALAVKNGAHEIDMVINVGRLKEDDQRKSILVYNEISGIRQTIPNAVLKVIIETCLLTKEEIKTVCRMSKDARVDFVKTSTGFSTSGARIKDVALMRRIVGEKMGVKASGGIRDLKTAEAMIEAGANRLGTSSGVKIIKELRLRAALGSLAPKHI